MPRYAVVEYHTYTVTYIVEVDSAEAAMTAVETSTVEEGDEEELGTDDVIVYQLPA